MTARFPASLAFVDSHTGGEPTRVLLCEDGSLPLGEGPMSDRLRRLCGEFDAVRSAVCNEPRASDIVVGAVLVPPHERSCDVGVLFFNNTGPLGMCGHGTIGVVETLRHLGRADAGSTVRLDTPAGVVSAELLAGGAVRFENVPARRTRGEVSVTVDGETLTGDVAYGGNWFYIAEESGPVDASQINRLQLKAAAAMTELRRAGITGDGGELIDHIELVTPIGPRSARGFVLCPGGAWDRSPCGTGTSAKLACLAAAGRLGEGEEWTQESVIGSRFTATYRRAGEAVVATICGRASVTAEGRLLFPPEDPLRFGWNAASAGPGVSTA